MVCMFKNEALYLNEWISFHRRLVIPRNGPNLLVIGVLPQTVSQSVTACQRVSSKPQGATFQIRSKNRGEDTANPPKKGV